MFIQTFNYDQENARRATSGGNFLVNSGKYLVTVTQAETGLSASGAQYVDFTFTADRGVEKTSDGTIGSARQMNAEGNVRLFITNRRGEQIFGANIFSSLLGLMGIQKAVARAAVCKNRKGENAQGFRFTCCEGKRIGLLLQRENYTYTDASGEQKDGFRFNLISAFDPVTGQTLSERLDGTQASYVTERLASLKDKGSAPQRRPNDFESKPRNGSSTQSQEQADMAQTEDVPF
jgi:hypothetical protein